MNTVEELAFQNACDCLRYGYGRNYWSACGLTGDEADKVWEAARNCMAKED